MNDEPNETRPHKISFLALAVIVEFILLLGLGTIFFIREFGPAGGDAADTTGVVTAREIRVVDQRDSVRAAILVDENGPRLRLFDESGNNRAALALNSGVPALVLFDEAGALRCVISLDQYSGQATYTAFSCDSMVVVQLSGSEGGGNFCINDSLGLPMISIGGNPYAGSYLRMASTSGMAQIQASVSQSIPYLSFRDEQGMERAAVLIGENGPFFAVYDRAQVLRAAMGSLVAGAVITLFDAAGGEQASLGAGSTTSNGRVQDYTEGSLRLFDTNGNATVILPVSY
jgi:hypothetical protein